MTAVDRPDNGQNEGRPWRVIGRYQDTGETVVMDGLRVVGSFYRPEEAARAVAAVNASGRAGAGEQQRELARWLRERVPLTSWQRDIRRYALSPAQADRLAAELLDRTQPDDDPGPQCPSTSHDTDGGWRCEHRAESGSGTASHHPRQEFHE